MGCIFDFEQNTFRTTSIQSNIPLWQHFFGVKFIRGKVLWAKSYPKVFGNEVVNGKIDRTVENE